MCRNMVNHSENSVSPEIGDDTQRIERLRRPSQIENCFKKMCGMNAK